MPGVAGQPSIAEGGRGVSPPSEGQSVHRRRRGRSSPRLTKKGSLPMTDPLIELIPGKTAVCSDASITLDVLVRITPPQPEVHFPRPPLNLALVLDRSGSMAMGKKMPFAREASTFAVQQLLTNDRVSVTTFDDRVEVIVAAGPATDKPEIVRRIGQVQPRGSTNLHGGWAEGARQAESARVGGGLNRVLLLSDGL